MSHSPEAVRDRLVEAALVEFAAHGFNGGSTRSIAQRADTHQPQINYHFGSKDGLWRACLERLLADLDEELAICHAAADANSSVATFEGTIRALVAFAARRPELNRIMMHEGSAPSERLKWLVETHLEDRYQALHSHWQSLHLGVASLMPPSMLYHTLIGAASLIYANSPEAELLGIDLNDPGLIEAHADALVEMFLGRFGSAAIGPPPETVAAR